MSPPSLVWLRQDMRLADQAAITAAAAQGPVVPVYVLDDGVARQWAMGGASRWWLHHSLVSMDRNLRAVGSRLILRRGDCAEQLAAVARQAGAGQVHALRHYEPWWRNAQKAVGDALDLRLHDGMLLAPPGAVRTGDGGHYKIYTPFARALEQIMPPSAPISAPDRLAAPDQWPDSDNLDDWRLLPTRPDWAGGMRAEWTPGEEGAKARLSDFLDEVRDYDATRNLPSQEGTSRLSPHLHFGEISIATLWYALKGRDAGSAAWRRELIWRDYAHNQIVQFPAYGSAPAREAFEAMPWRDLAEAGDDFTAWTRGLTGYPIVDAGMRQLWGSGWMHNRVRMIAASFLVKHLLIDWRNGARWFWDTLVDASYANNSVNWQWVTGSGVDANMFPRIMAPLSQSPKFDAADYIRQWVPELAHLGDNAIHDPEAFGRRPAGYPAKIIDHRAGRQRALAAFAAMKG